jgi:hypothetical protein
MFQSIYYINVCQWYIIYHLFTRILHFVAVVVIVDLFINSQTAFNQISLKCKNKERRHWRQQIDVDVRRSTCATASATRGVCFISFIQSSEVEVREGYQPKNKNIMSDTMEDTGKWYEHEGGSCIWMK